MIIMKNKTGVKREWSSNKRYKCKNCGVFLPGLGAKTCPGCGLEIDWDDIEGGISSAETNSRSN